MYEPSSTTYFEMDADKIADLTLKHYGKKYEASWMEIGGDESGGETTVSVGADATLNEYEIKDLDDFFSDPKTYNEYLLDTIVTKLVVDGHLPAGDYLISDEWG